MFLLDANTGVVTWGEYELNIDLTPDTFIQKYPQIPLIEEKHDPGGYTIKTYQLPSIVIGEHVIALQPRFFDQYFESIHIEREVSMGREEQSRDTETWWKEELKWLHTAREIVRAQFGEPHLTEYPELYDEPQYFPSEFLDQLRDWQYKFTWGKAGVGYMSERIVCLVWIGYKF